MAGVSLHHFPFFERPAAEPVSGPPHILKWRRPAPPFVQRSGDSAEARLPAPASSGTCFLPAAMAGPSEPAHLLFGLQTVEQGEHF